MMIEEEEEVPTPKVAPPLPDTPRKGHVLLDRPFCPKSSCSDWVFQKFGAFSHLLVNKFESDPSSSYERLMAVGCAGFPCSAGGERGGGDEHRGDVGAEGRGAR